jgi:hypothetical protein
MDPESNVITLPVRRRPLPPAVISPKVEYSKIIARVPNHPHMIDYRGYRADFDRWLMQKQVFLDTTYQAWHPPKCFVVRCSDGNLAYCWVNSGFRSSPFNTMV